MEEDDGGGTGTGTSTPEAAAGAATIKKVCKATYSEYLQAASAFEARWKDRGVVVALLAACKVESSTGGVAYYTDVTGSSELCEGATKIMETTGKLCVQESNWLSAMGHAKKKVLPLALRDCGDIQRKREALREWLKLFVSMSALEVLSAIKDDAALAETSVACLTPDVHKPHAGARKAFSLLTWKVVQTIVWPDEAPAEPVPTTGADVGGVRKRKANQAALYDSACTTLSAALSEFGIKQALEGVKMNCGKHGEDGEDGEHGEHGKVCDPTAYELTRRTNESDLDNLGSAIERYVTSQTRSHILDAVSDRSSLAKFMTEIATTRKKLSRDAQSGEGGGARS